MKYWLTTHWPHLRTAPRDASHRGVWVPNEKREVIAPLAVGDLAWIYESQSGRSILRQKAAGDAEVLRRHSGRGGIVALVQVTDTPEEDPEREEETYVDGSTIWWRWWAPTRTVNSAGFIDRETLNGLMGYEAGYVFRGFGTKRSGLKEIAADLHAAIHEAFLTSHRKMDEERLTRTRTGVGRGSGGEGPVHKRLKEWLAANPELALGESGLRHIQTEYSFGATGDRIDVLLRDEHGRYVAVEVEPECDVDHVAGPMQCVKYRALLAYQLDRQLEEVRTYLVAHHIHDAVRAKAVTHGIECRVVDDSAAHVGLLEP